MFSARPTSLLCLAALALAPGIGRAESPRAPEPTSDAIANKLPPRPRALVLPRVQLPMAPEGDDGAVGSAGFNPFGKAAVPNATTAGQTLTAPVTVNANASSNALTITQTGTGSALSGTVNNSSSATSAVKGLGNGSGAGIYGSNSGKSGQAGKFEITNASSAQPAVLATTTGTGSGVQAIVKSASQTDAPAVLGQNAGTNFYGIGVQGQGGYIGVNAIGVQYGVYGRSTYAGNGIGAVGVMGESAAGPGMFGYSESLYENSFGVQGYSAHYAGVYGSSEVALGVYGVSTSNSGVQGLSGSGHGVHGESTSNAGVYGRSQTKDGVYGESATGFAIHGVSTAGGYAGYFAGDIRVTGAVYATTYAYTSDRDQKQDFAAIDLGDVLSRVAAMPITAWDYKAKPAQRHIGPMAQDFHAAFGLGTDDKHIDVVDGVGVSLAAIKALQQQVAEKTARIDRLEAKLQVLQDTVDARLAALEQSVAPAITTALASDRP